MEQRKRALHLDQALLQRRILASRAARQISAKQPLYEMRPAAGGFTAADLLDRLRRKLLMCQIRDINGSIAAVSVTLIIAGLGPLAAADEPCGELDECRVLIEINASDGDLGFHVLFDADDWRAARITDPNGRMLFKEQAHASLKDQLLTENFFESSEPVCEAGLADDEDDVVVTLPEFFERFPAGLYDLRSKLAKGGELAGTTLLTHIIPAAPANVDFDGSAISWEYGDDLGECTTFPDGFMLAQESDIVGYEVVLEPDDPEGFFSFTVRVPSDVAGTSYSVTVPPEYLALLGPDAPFEIEVGAIERRPNGSPGNQTFTEEGGFCNNPVQEDCPDEDD
jgi:hypothetical protein